jgi:hypothetical protein
MKEELLKELKRAIIENYWEDKNLIIRSLFTTLVYVEDIHVDDAEPILKDLYDVGEIKELDISFREFKYFMLQDIEKQL